MLLSFAQFEREVSAERVRDKIAAIDFRYKKFGWDASYLNIKYKDGSDSPELPFYLKPLKNLKKGLLLRSVYLRSFGISNLYERPSCHACHFKGIERTADFSVRVYPKWSTKNMQDMIRNIA